MGTINSKVRGIQLPGQSGKTRKMEEKLTQYMIETRNEGSEDDLNIMFTSNSRLLVHQTYKRFDSNLGPETNDDVTIVTYDSDDSENEENMVILKNGCTQWTSKENNYSSVEQAYFITQDEISMLVCCSHPKRWNKMVELLDLLEKNKHFKKNINIWIDEAHKSISIWKKYVSLITSLKKIKKVTLVTASWDPIDKYYKIPREPYAITHPDVYRSLHECKFIIIEPSIQLEDETRDNNSTAPAYIAMVLSNPEVKKLIQPGQMWLLPGNSKTKTHDAIEEDLIESNWNGLKLNGNEKNFAFHIDKQKIDYNDLNTDNLEAKDVIAKAYNKYPSLYNAPFFVTGLNCIKEGITFQSNNHHFRGGILPPMTDPSDAYQVACRLNGNIKNDDAYNPDIPCTIITTSKMEKIMKRQENINIFLPRILYEEGRTLPTDFDKNRAAKGIVKHDPKGKGYRIFKSQTSFINYLKKFGLRSGFSNGPNGTEDYDGMYVCSVQSKRGATQKPRYVTEVIDKIDLAYGGSGAKKTGFPAYKNLTEINGKIYVKDEDLVWVAVIHSDMDKEIIKKSDIEYPDESIEILKESKHYTEN